MIQESKEKRKEKVIEVLNQARAMELRAIHQYMNRHYNLDNMDYGNYFDNVNNRIEKLGPVYLAQIAGTPSSTGLPARGFIASQGGATPAGA